MLGVGKMIFVLRVVIELLDCGEISRLIVVVPMEYFKW